MSWLGSQIVYKNDCWDRRQLGRSKQGGRTELILNWAHNKRIGLTESVSFSFQPHLGKSTSVCKL